MGWTNPDQDPTFWISDKLFFPSSYVGGKQGPLILTQMFMHSPSCLPSMWERWLISGIFPEYLPWSACTSHGLQNPLLSMMLHMTPYSIFQLPTSKSSLVRHPSVPPPALLILAIAIFFVAFHSYCLVGLFSLLLPLAWVTPEQARELSIYLLKYIIP